MLDTGGGLRAAMEVCMKALEALVNRYVLLSLRRPWLLIAIYAAITVASLLLATRLKLETDLKDLLPADAPSVVALDEARTRQGSSDKFVIAVDSPDPLKTLAFIDALAAELNGWEAAESIEIKQDRQFLLDHALLFLPVEDLGRIKGNLQRMVRKKLAENNPLFIDFEEDDDGSGTAEAIEEVNWRDPFSWIDRLSLAELGVTDAQINEGVVAFDEAVGELDGSAAAAPEASGAALAKAEVEAEAKHQAAASSLRKLPKKYRDYMVARGGEVAVLTARMKGRSTDTAYAKQVFERGQKAINKLDPKSFHPQMRALVVGPYGGYTQVKQISNDASSATTLSVVLVLALLVLFFRNLRSIPIIMPALFVGQAWTFGIIAVTYGRLNILTAFVFAMLVGMGIDFAVHVYGRSLEKFNEGHSWEEAIFDAIWKTGRALISAWLTTVVALAMLIFAHFEGFREFGVVCTLGITVCLGTTFLIIPPLIGATERVSRAKRRPPAPDSALPTGKSRWLLRLSSAVFLLLALWGAYASREVGFEYNLRKLEGSKPTQGIKYGAALGSGKSSTPAIILGHSEAQMREVHKLLRSRLRAGDPRLTSFLTVETFLPSDMDARLGVIDEIHDILNKKALKRLEGSEGEAISALLELTEVEPFTAKDLPEWVRRSLTEKDGSFGHIGLLYGKYRDADSKDVAAFQKLYGSIPTSMGDVKVSTSGFILSDVVRYVQADGKLLWLVMLSLIVILLLDFRDLFATVVCLACLVAGILITLGIMWAYDLKVGLFNMVVLPTALGIGIDGATHIYHRFKEEGPDRIWFILKTTGNSVIAAALTTVAGFIGLAFVDHAGIRSLGQLAVISITVCMAAAIGILPGLLTFSKYQPKRAEGEPKAAEAEPKE